ncbi:DUF3592 domain-containing protein [Streptomyces glaucescens]|uniref:DUF3592 domain-containing protein n=1 Tax=Streptomyces glaucescens TaxID=1907 RepID=UPI00344E725E
MDHAWLFSLIPLLIGVSFLCVGVYGLRRASALRRSGITAVGRVVLYDTRRDGDGVKYHHPVVAWTARDGREYTHRSMLGRGTVPPGFGAGRSVTVLYDPTDPGRFEIQGWDSRALYLVFAWVGTALTAGTVLLLIIRVITL